MRDWSSDDHGLHSASEPPVLVSEPRAHAAARSRRRSSATWLPICATACWPSTAAAQLVLINDEACRIFDAAARSGLPGPAVRRRASASTPTSSACWAAPSRWRRCPTAPSFGSSRPTRSSATRCRSFATKTTRRSARRCSSRTSPTSSRWKSASGCAIGWRRSARWPRRWRTRSRIRSPASR